MRASTPHRIRRSWFVIAVLPLWPLCQSAPWSSSVGSLRHAELAELLQFLGEWLARDPDRLCVSLEAFVGHPAYGPAQLRQDLNRFTFLLGGESLFGPGAPGVG